MTLIPLSQKLITLGTYSTLTYTQVDCIDANGRRQRFMVYLLPLTQWEVHVSISCEELDDKHREQWKIATLIQSKDKWNLLTPLKKVGEGCFSIFSVLIFLRCRARMALIQKTGWTYWNALSHSELLGSPGAGSCFQVDISECIYPPRSFQ